ncbi:MAG: site-2 protease family protein [Halobacteria archaeon]
MEELSRAGMEDDVSIYVARRIHSIMDVYQVDTESGEVRYYGIPKEEEIERTVQELDRTVRNDGYVLELNDDKGEHVVTLSSREESFPWLNLILACLTFLTTLAVGTAWYNINPSENPFSLLRGLPFAVSVMGVLAAHEFGHYLLARRHGVEASLPYFIPFPSLIGTLGAVINVRGHIPDRRALFDIGIAGPLLGLVATILVTVVGLKMPVVETSAAENAEGIVLHFPPLYHIIKDIVGSPPGVESPNINPNPVVVGGWVGMFLTFLNLLPVGQLDGGHILKATLGDRARYIGYGVPVVLFSLGVYVHFVLDKLATVWFFWGVLILILGVVGSVDLPNRGMDLGWKRKILAIVVLAFGLLVFTPVPIELTG